MLFASLAPLFGSPGHAECGVRPGAPSSVLVPSSTARSLEQPQCSVRSDLGKGTLSRPPPPAWASSAMPMSALCVGDSTTTSLAPKPSTILRANKSDSSPFFGPQGASFAMPTRPKGMKRAPFCRPAKTGFEPTTAVWTSLDLHPFSYSEKAIS